MSAEYDWTTERMGGDMPGDDWYFSVTTTQSGRKYRYHALDGLKVWNVDRRYWERVPCPDRWNPDGAIDLYETAQRTPETATPGL